jgi:hypothetical protein
MKSAWSADGARHEFPDETSQDVIDKAMKTYADEHPNKTSTLQEVGRGMADPAYGLAQAASHAITPSSSGMDAAVDIGLSAVPGIGPGLALAKHALTDTNETAMDRVVREREESIQKERGGTKDFDWARLGGNVASPVNLIGGPALKGAGAGVNFARGILGGIIGGLSQPVTEGSYGAEKPKQVAIGAGTGGVVSGIGQLASKGIEKAGEFVSRNLPENVNIDAAKALIGRFKQDEKAGGMSATEALDKVNMPALPGDVNKPTALVDVGGKNVQGLAGRVARQPGEGRAIAENFLTNRDNEAAVRLSGDIQKYVSGGPSVFRATQDLIAQRSTAARPLYEATRSLENIWSPRLQQFIDDPDFKTGLARGFHLERLAALAEGRPITATQLGVDLDLEGNIVMKKVPNMRLLDMAKQGVDAMIADERDQLTGRLTQRGLLLNRARVAYLEELDSLDTSGVYKQARAAWAGYSKALDSLRMGRAVLRGNAEENAAAFNGLSDSEKEFYRMGVADQLKEKMAKTGLHGDEAKALIKNPWMRDMLRPAFRSNADFDKFVDSVSTETKMFETGRKVLGGSQTGERVAEDTSAMDPMAIGLRAMLKAPSYLAHPLHAVADAWRMYRDMGIKPPEELNTKIAQILFSPKLDEADAVIKALRSGKVPQKTNRFAGAANAASVAGAGAGTGAGVGAVDIATQP